MGWKVHPKRVRLGAQKGKSGSGSTFFERRRQGALATWDNRHRGGSKMVGICIKNRVHFNIQCAPKYLVNVLLILYYEIRGKKLNKWECLIYM